MSDPIDPHLRNDVYDALASIVHAVAAGVDETGDLKQFASVAEVASGWCCNTLSAWPGSMGMYRTSTWRPETDAQRCKAARTVLPVQGKLLRACAWPTAREVSFTAVEDSSAQLLLDGKQVLDALRDANSAGTLLPWHGRQAYGFSVRWIQPSGGCAGVYFSLYAELPGDC